MSENRGSILYVIKSPLLRHSTGVCDPGYWKMALFCLKVFSGRRWGVCVGGGAPSSTVV